MTTLIPGATGPLGWTVQYLRAPADDVLETIGQLRAQWAQQISISRPPSRQAALVELTPFESPWTRELLLRCGSWTAYMNNGLNGGDATAIGPVIARAMQIDCVVATHTARYGPGHQQTSLSVTGPDGQGPLMTKRVVCLDCGDGRWTWFTDGVPMPFEDLDRYKARKKRDRLDQRLLHSYLRSLDIPVDDDDAYTDPVLVQEHVEYPRRTVSLEDSRRSIIDA